MYRFEELFKLSYIIFQQYRWQDKDQKKTIAPVDVYHQDILMTATFVNRLYYFRKVPGKKKKEQATGNIFISG